MGIEAELNGLPPNPLEVQLHQMQETAREMARYYYKGFAAALSGILGNASFVLVNPRDSRYRERSYEILKAIEEFYDRIQFGKLDGRDELWSPLFVTKMMLPKFREHLDEVFKQKSKEALARLEVYAKSVANVGSLYAENMDKLLERIRSMPKGADFTVVIPYQSRDEIWHA